MHICPDPSLAPWLWCHQTQGWSPLQCIRRLQLLKDGYPASPKIPSISRLLFLFWPFQSLLARLWMIPALPFLFTLYHLKLHQVIAPLPQEEEFWWEQPDGLYNLGLGFVFCIVHWTGFLHAYLLSSLSAFLLLPPLLQTGEVLLNGEISQENGQN